MKAIIVEDELHARQELEYLIKTYSKIEITHSFEDGLDVLNFLQENETDAIFLDINIPSLDGMFLANNLSKFKKQPFIIFTTAYKEHAAEAFELEAFDYILKPYDEERIAAMSKKLEKAYEESQAATSSPMKRSYRDQEIRKKVNLRKNEKYIVTDVRSIYYCEANEKETIVYTKNEEYSMPMSISEFHSQLPAELFFRSHRSFLVNLSKIHEIVPWFNQTYLLRFKDSKAEVPVSRSNVNTFKKLMDL
jgi:two-component system LytT family response regulator